MDLDKDLSIAIDNRHIGADLARLGFTVPEYLATADPDFCPPKNLVSPWDGAALVSSLAAFVIFISLALLSQPDFETTEKHATLSVRLQEAKPSVKKPEKEKSIAEQASEAMSTELEKIQDIESAPSIESPQHKETTEEIESSVKATTLDYDLIQSIIKEEELYFDGSIKQHESKNTEAHNTVFDNRLRQQLHSEKLRDFNRRRQSIDVGNYIDQSGVEHFSDGKGNCFKIIDNAGETMWVRKACLKIQERTFEFGRLITK
ncbi:hypothetical protein [uncultured Pseudoteredinibacter sp.]|uniref:hypothetical protein n=1 Tax=uncultured Pseudoteredinibacter sp. TaxID=1641701 RepID=UPI0026266E82|nr:hypothetical protein [uncultured Pseudoteredinibacter sp.]